MQRFGNKKALIVHVGQNGYHVPDTSKAGNDNRFVQHFLMNSRQNVFNKKFCFICSYDRAKQRHSKNKEGKLSPGLHLASAAEAGALVSYANF